jgi:hypothetical protein
MIHAPAFGMGQLPSSDASTSGLSGNGAHDWTARSISQAPDHLIFRRTTG